MQRDTAIARGSASIPGSDYREFPASGPLAEHIFCLWTHSITGTKGIHEHRVFPDACTDILQINHNPPVVIGPWTEAFLARLEPGTVIVGARFCPGQSAAFLGLPSSKLLNCSVRLFDLWNRTCTERFDRVAEQDTPAARVAALEAALLHRIEDSAPVDRIMAAATRWLSLHPEGTVDELARWLGVSNRQLQRRFVSTVGYGPKLFQSVLRFQRLLCLFEQPGSTLDLARKAGEAGYADQAHMTREVRRFAGLTPGALLPSAGCALRLSGLLQAS